MLEKIQSLISHIPRSRIHALKTFDRTKVKRDDELGFGVSGSKARKYTSLIPYLLEHGYKEAVVIGGAYSNNVLSLSQLLIENRIKPVLFLIGDLPAQKQGNFLLTSLLVPEEQMHWISSEAEAMDLVKEFPSAKLIPEGACMAEALPGALTLALDIEESFDHLFLDAGTGLSAIATILAFSWLKRKTQIHVLLLADDEEAFLAKLKKFQVYFESLVGEVKNLAPFQLHRPTEAKSFGSVNAGVIDHIKTLARDEGFFTDPIYSAKLFWEAKKLLPSLKGSVLIVHSGGALTLMGYQNKFII